MALQKQLAISASIYDKKRYITLQGHNVSREGYARTKGGYVIRFVSPGACKFDC